MNAKTRKAALAAIALCLPASAAHATALESIADSGTIRISGTSPRHVTRTMLVKVADLDMASDKGLRRLGYRIEYASEQVCDPSSLASLQQRADFQHCMQGARRSGWDQAQRFAAAQGHALPQLAVN